MPILVLDDDPDLLEILGFALRRDGYDVMMARDGACGLRLWRSKEPICVLLDVNLPKIDGWEVCKQIREESTTPIVILTVNDRVSDMARAFELGVDDYITKPFSPSELTARVRAVLRRPMEPADQAHELHRPRHCDLQPPSGMGALPLSDIQMERRTSTPIGPRGRMPMAGATRTTESTLEYIHFRRP